MNERQQKKFREELSAKAGQLKRCPFCGSEGHIVNYRGLRTASCNRCWFVAPTYLTRREAVDAWNERVSEDKQIPKPSADCLPGYMALPVFIDSDGMLSYETYKDHYPLDLIIRHPSWSGRYGYNREDGVVCWNDCSRIYTNGKDYVCRAVGKWNTVVFPDWVEMKEEK